MIKRKSISLILLEIFAGVLVALSIVFIIVFIVNFAGSPLSKSMTEWGEFGSYAAFIASILNLVFFIVLTYKASEFQQTSYKHQSKFQKVTFNQQMLAQKIELKTSFRKSHIEDIRQRLFDLNNITYYDISKKDEFDKFKRDCESLTRIFKIYKLNINYKLVGNCDYNAINEQLDKLRTLIADVNGNVGATNEQCRKIWDVLNDINAEIIALEKCLSDYTLTELEKAFEDAYTDD